MSCQNEAYSSLIVIPVPRRGRSEPSAFMTVAVAFTDAFREALQMREAAYRRHPFDE